nr:MAG TPA: hypothetical protein [Caudoviricetes sp.]
MIKPRFRYLFKIILNIYFKADMSVFYILLILAIVKITQKNTTFIS